MTANYREISNRVKKVLKQEFPQCKFSVSVNYYGGDLIVCKAPSSWYSEIFKQNPRDYLNSMFGMGWVDQVDELTSAGKKAALKLYRIMLKELSSVTGSYYDETLMDSVVYSPSIYMFGTYSKPLELINDTMNGHRTSAPSKKYTQSVKVNVRKMF